MAASAARFARIVFAFAIMLFNFMELRRGRVYRESCLVNAALRGEGQFKWSNTGFIKNLHDKPNRSYNNSTWSPQFSSRRSEKPVGSASNKSIAPASVGKDSSLQTVDYTWVIEKYEVPRDTTSLIHGRPDNIPPTLTCEVCRSSHT